jgi:hypothetical protein
MRLLVESDLKPKGGVIGAGFEEFRWPRPVRPGDELRVESEILEVRPSKVAARRGASQASHHHAQSARPGGADHHRQPRRSAPPGREVKAPEHCARLRRSVILGLANHGLTCLAITARAPEQSVV